MAFEVDPDKSAANRSEHGIDFNDAQALWDDPRLLEAPARTVDEPRFIVIGRIEGQHWSAVCARRGGRTRIVPVRRARIEEPAYRMSSAMKAPEMKAGEFDRAFDSAEDVNGHVDWPQARRVNLEARRVNVDFPAWVVDALDREARLRGVPRQSLIKLWIADRLQETL